MIGRFVEVRHGVTGADWCGAGVAVGGDGGPGGKT